MPKKHSKEAKSYYIELTMNTKTGLSTFETNKQIV